MSATSRVSSGRKIRPPLAASWWATKTSVSAASGSPAVPVTLKVERWGRSRRNRCGPPETSSTIPAAASSPSSRRAARRGPPRARQRRQQPQRQRHRADRGLLLDARGHARAPRAARGSTPPPAARPPRRTAGRSPRGARRWRAGGRGPAPWRAESIGVPCGGDGRGPGLPVLQDRGGGGARHARPRGRAHDRVHGHQPRDPRPPARGPARARRRRARDRPGGPEGRRRGRQGPRAARARPARRRRREPAQLGRQGRLADRLPLPPARDPALRQRSRCACRGSPSPATATRSRPPPRS